MFVFIQDPISIVVMLRSETKNVTADVPICQISSIIQIRSHVPRLELVIRDIVRRILPRLQLSDEAR